MDTIVKYFNYLNFLYFTNYFLHFKHCYGLHLYMILALKVMIIIIKKFIQFPNCLLYLILIKEMMTKKFLLNRYHYNLFFLNFIKNPTLKLRLMTWKKSKIHLIIMNLGCPKILMICMNYLKIFYFFIYILKFLNKTIINLFHIDFSYFLILLPLILFLDLMIVENYFHYPSINYLS